MRLLPQVLLKLFVQHQFAFSGLVYVVTDCDADVGAQCATWGKVSAN